MKKYILKDKIPVLCEDVSEWGLWFDKADRVVARTQVSEHISVSTVFIGIDHSFSPESAVPILFETMIFGGDEDGLVERYSTWTEAEEGHHEVCRMAFSS